MHWLFKILYFIFDVLASWFLDKCEDIPEEYRVPYFISIVRMHAHAQFLIQRDFRRSAQEYMINDHNNHTPICWSHGQLSWWIRMSLPFFSDLSDFVLRYGIDGRTFFTLQTAKFTELLHGDLLDVRDQFERIYDLIDTSMTWDE